MSDCSRAAFKVKEKPEIRLSDLTEELRSKLDAHGIPWKDASEEFGSDDYTFHMERTKVLNDDIEIASCIYGWTVIDDYLSGSTYGFPYCIEIGCSQWFGSSEPEPKTINEIVDWLSEYWREVDA